MACAICEVRKPRRFCPGVNGDICTVCCGTEREVTVTCPLDCIYLQEARRHEKLPDVDPDQFPNRDIRLTEDFVHENQELLLLIARSVMEAAFETRGAVDLDVRDALDSLIRTYRTLLSGVYYESRPVNAFANNMFSLVQEAIAEFRRQEQQRSGLSHVRDAEILGVLAFLQRLELSRNNGRPRSRAFLDFLRRFFPAEAGAAAPRTSSLILP